MTNARKRGLQEGFDITKLVGAIVVAGLASVATMAGIEDGSDPTGPVGLKGSRIERGAVSTLQSISNVDPLVGGTDGSCTQEQCNLTCTIDFPNCTITYAACFTNPDVGHAQCACAKGTCFTGGQPAPSAYKTCAVQQDSSDGR